MNLNLNLTKDDSNINDYLITYHNMGSNPNRTIIHDRFSGIDFVNFIESFSKDSNKNLFTEYLPIDDSYVINERVLRKIDDDIWISYVGLNKESDLYMISDVCIYYKVDDDVRIPEIISSITSFTVDYEEVSSNKINTLILDHTTNSLEVVPISIDEKIEIESMYSSKTIKKVEKLIKSIKKSNKGLSVFTGDRGTGKTNIAKYVASKIDRISIFIPNNMLEQTINNSDFVNFIKRFDKTLIIIDDCEFLYNPVYGKMNYFTNNILQLVDGFMSDHLNIQVLLIFNDNKDNIDENIIECNSIIEILEFEEIESDIATELSRKVGIGKKYKNSAKLVDVFKDKKTDNKNDIGLK